MKKQIRIKVNGHTNELNVPVGRLLVDLLREDLKLTGTKMACGEGECGACTVLLNGKPVPSCLMLAAEADGCEITTIEGLSDGEKLDPLQEGFISEGAAQCGFCTPGMILTARAFLNEKPNPTEEEIRRALSGNLCRCTGYGAIVRAVQTAAERE